MDDAASSFQELNFIVEHIGMPRVRDFTFIAAQGQDIYAGLSVVMPFIHARPRFFAEMLGEVPLLARAGPHPFRQRLRALDAAVAHRPVP